MSVQTSYSVSMTAAVEGQVISFPEGGILPMQNNESTAVIPFGVAVCFEGSTDDKGALLPVDSNSKIAGIVAKSLAYGIDPFGDLDQTTVCGTLRTGGVKPGGILNVMRKGKLWVKPETAVAPGDRLYVRHDVNTGENTFEFKGNVDNGTDESDMIDLTAVGEFLTTAGAGEPAVLEVDFTNKP